MDMMKLRTNLIQAMYNEVAGIVMKTYTGYEVGELTIYVTDGIGTVHHAVNYNDKNVVTLYPYEPKNGGWDNVCGEYTLEQVKNRIKTGKISFR